MLLIARVLPQSDRPGSKPTLQLMLPCSSTVPHWLPAPSCSAHLRRHSQRGLFGSGATARPLFIDLVTSQRPCSMLGYDPKRMLQLTRAVFTTFASLATVTFVFVPSLRHHTRRAPARLSSSTSLSAWRPTFRACHSLLVFCYWNGRTVSTGHIQTNNTTLIGTHAPSKAYANWLRRICEELLITMLKDATTGSHRDHLTDVRPDSKS